MADFLVTFPSPGGEGFVGGKVKESFGGTHFEELADRFSAIGSGEDVGLKAVALAGRAGNEDIGKKLHGDFLVAHASATFAPTSARVEGEGGCGQPCALGFLGRGVKFADKIVNIEIEEGSGARGLGERGLIHEEDVGDLVLPSDGFDGGGIFYRPAHVMEKGFVNDFVDEGAFA